MRRLRVTERDLRQLLCLGEELRDLPFGDQDQATRHLLATVNRLVGGANAYWVIALRDETATGPALLGGWSVPGFGFLEATDALHRDGAEAAARLAEGEPDRMTACYAMQVGRDRAARPVDLMPRAEWENDWYVRDHLATHGFTDLVQGSSRVHRRAEVTIGFLRDGRRRIGERERDVLLLASAILRQPIREIVVAGGWLGPDGSLSGRERQVLDCLLSGMSEGEIAEDLAISLNTAHHHVTAVYRKLGVQGKGGLLGLWTGRTRSSNGDASPIR